MDGHGTDLLSVRISNAMVHPGRPVHRLLHHLAPMGSLPALLATDPCWEVRAEPFHPLRSLPGGGAVGLAPNPPRQKGQPPRPGPARPRTARPGMAERRSDHRHRLTSPRPAPQAHWLTPAGARASPPSPGARTARLPGAGSEVNGLE